MWKKHCRRMKWIAWTIVVVVVIWAVVPVDSVHVEIAAAAVQAGELLQFFSMQIKFHSMEKLTPIHYNQFRMFFFSRNSIFFCLSDFHRGNNNRNNNSDGWMPNNTYSNNGGFNSNNNGNWGGNSQPTPWNNNSSNSQGKNQMNATCW